VQLVARAQQLPNPYEDDDHYDAELEELERENADLDRGLDEAQHYLTKSAAFVAEIADARACITFLNGLFSMWCLCGWTWPS
jgi:hypothetical protein